ncbi:3-hydroxybutyryl-CoA dehydrogenase [Conexibacter sp. SYSU D00693]|uniref:3-hydroxybutyryl-CoA dehydrogenase n=1 Tax=Conexibacter sp. SYSU D00693 TaxID=2812560 RepID=UPI00196A7793|nr:3-hydroxybutyryl-CoA dehydrogenase [Conexibacter sp. SYSU D00693]
MQVGSAAVVGAGFMGSGIAESAARAGCRVVVHEPERPPLERSRDKVHRSVEKAVKAGKLDDGAAGELLGRLSWSTDLDELSGAEVVMEAVIEDPKVKGKLFQRLDRALPDARILATNTSSIPIAEVASWTARRDRVVGLHFFSPVPVMKLVEVVRGIDTSDDVLREAEAFAHQIGKQPIRTKDRSGFIVNMLLVPYLMSGIRMYEDGFASREDIDKGMKLGCGHPMGPLELADFIGLDVMYAIGQSLYEEFKRPDFAPPPLLKRMVVSGHFGRKSGRGFYEYETAPAKVAA